MRLSSRIRQLEATEVVQVALALKAVRDAMTAAEEKQDEYFHTQNQPNADWLGASKKKTEASREDVASWNLKEVRRHFDPAMAAVEVWLLNGTDSFFPLVCAWDEGDESLTGSLPELVRVRAEAAAAYESHKTALRSHLAFIPPVRGAANGLFTAIRNQRRVEDVEIIPSVLSGRRDTSTQAIGRVADRYKTADDVARSLRMARPPELARDQEPEPESKGLLASFRNLFKRQR